MDTNTNSTAATIAAQTNPGFAAFKAETSISFVRAYDPKSVAITGFTHQVIRYRDTSKGTAVKPAKMVTVPSLVLPAALVDLVPLSKEAEEIGIEPSYQVLDGYAMPEKARTVLLGVLEDGQSDMIRSMIEDGKSVIEWDSVSLEKVLDFLTAARTSSRLTKEAVEAWAKIALAEACKDRATEIATSKGFDAEKTLKQIEGTTAAYVSNMGKLSAAVPNIGQETALSLQIMLEKSGNDDDIAKALRKKLHTILNPVAANNGDL